MKKTSSKVELYTPLSLFFGAVSSGGIALLASGRLSPELLVVVGSATLISGIFACIFGYLAKRDMNDNAASVQLDAENDIEEPAVESSLQEISIGNEKIPVHKDFMQACEGSKSSLSSYYIGTESIATICQREFAQHMELTEDERFDDKAGLKHRIAKKVVGHLMEKLGPERKKLIGDITYYLSLNSKGDLQVALAAKSKVIMGRYMNWEGNLNFTYTTTVEIPQSESEDVKIKMHGFGSIHGEDKFEPNDVILKYNTPGRYSGRREVTINPKGVKTVGEPHIRLTLPSEATTKESRDKLRENP
jgi:hypothetical protein